MKKWILILAMLAMLAGCDTTSQQRIAYLQSALATGQTTSAHLGDQLDRLTTAVEDLQVQLADPNLNVEQVKQIQELIAKGQGVMAMVKENKAKVDGMIAVWKADIDKAVAEGNSVNIGTEIQLIGSGLGAAAAIPTPISPWLLLASAIVSAIGGVIAKSKIDKPKLDETEGLLNEIINGVNAFKTTADASAKATLKTALNSQITEANRAKINAIADA